MQVTGPMVSDEQFFQVCLDLERDDLKEVRVEAEKKDYKKARHAFAEHVRESLKPERFFTIPFEWPENIFFYPGETEEEIADRVCTGELISCGTPCKFQGKVDWFSNPTYNKYAEWTWQLSRHNEWKILAHMYRKTGNEKYAKTCADLFESWVKQAVRPDDTEGFQTLCWRTIECGIRMGANWPYVLHSFYTSEAFTDDILVDWYKSVYEHAVRLKDHHMSGNWLIMEMNGLAHISILYEEFKQAKEWRNFAFAMLGEELKKQIYPDGFQYELSTGYHDVVINNFQRLIRTAQAYEVNVPEEFYQVLEKAAQINVKLMMPSGQVPDINDGNWKQAADLLEPKMELFPDNTVFQWVVSKGKQGEKPSFTSCVLPYSGFAVMRTGWKKEDTWGLLDCAPFGRGHQHEDKLSFLMYAGGKLLLTEGGNYAYDTSKMREYVLSSASHNTILVDGMGQNRRKNYVWKDEDIKKKADMQYSLTDDVDYAKAEYTEGYGDDVDRSVEHCREVYFMKRIEETKPFFIVVDRIKADKEHTYELLWHLNEDWAQLQKKMTVTKNLTVFTAEDIPEWELIIGQEDPQWQGFVATASIQGCYRPVPTLSQKIKGKEVRIVTVFYPESGWGCPMEEVMASNDPKDGTIIIRMKGKRELYLDEKQLRGTVE